jgi:hypothetical protein
MSGSTVSSRVSEPAAPATHEPQIAANRERPLETRGAHWQRRARRGRLRLSAHPTGRPRLCSRGTCLVRSRRTEGGRFDPAVAARLRNGHKEMKR